MKKLVLLCCVAIISFLPQKAEAQFGWLADSLEFCVDVVGACVDTVCETAGATVQTVGQVGVAAGATVLSGGSVWLCESGRDFCNDRFREAGDAWVEAAEDICEDWREVGAEDNTDSSGSTTSGSSSGSSASGKK